jgi:plastocyanin
MSGGAKRLENDGLTQFGGAVCLQFTEAKQYDYKCSAHGFVGKVTVQ